MNEKEREKSTLLLGLIACVESVAEASQLENESVPVHNKEEGE
jgi:hypothetical protein